MFLSDLKNAVSRKTRLKFYLSFFHRKLWFTICHACTIQLAF